MEEQSQELEVYHSVSQVANTLKLNENTFTGYYLKFVDQGYTFKKIDGKVMFSPDEIDMFRDFLAEMKKPKTTIKQAIDKILNPTVIVKKSEIETLITSHQKGFEELQVQSQQHLQQLQLQSEQQFQELKNEFKEVIREERETMLKVFESKLNDTVDIQSRAVTKAIRDIQEEEAQKQIASAEEEQKKKKWWKFWE